MNPGNGKFGDGSGRALGSNSAWQAVLFAVVGSVGFLLILSLADFVTKHNQNHRSYTEYIVLALLGLGIPVALYFRRTFGQFYPGVVSMFKRLEWYHWLWFVIFMSGLVFRKRTASEGMEAPVDSAAMFRIAAVGAVGATLLVKLFMKKLDWIRSAFTGIVGLLVWFDLMTLLSTIWSVYWQWTLYKSIEYGVDVCLLAVILYVVKKSDEYLLFMNWTWALYGVMLLNIWFGCIWDPKDALLKGGIYGVQGIGGLGVWLQGVFPDVSSNQIAEYAGCVAVIALCRLLPMNRRREKTALYSVIFIFGFVTMIFAQTRSAVAGFCVAVFLIYLFSSRVGQGAMIVFSGLTLTIVSGFGQYIFDYLKRGQSANQLESFSSRLEWWEVALEKFAMYPFTGLGMWAAARFGVLAKLGFTQTATIHSDWVEIIVGTGAWGLTPVLLLMGTAWYMLIKCTINQRLNMKDRQLAYEGMAVLAVVTARMFFMTDLSLHPPCHFFAALGCAEFLRRKIKKQGLEEDDASAELSAAAGA
ncbi:MAG TPA: O-antigen ligase family protein [Terriglobales bacterium]|nr:O-antigen ligase family protein [Terriglobales bacterium]